MAAREILEDFEPAPSNLVIGRILNRGSYGVIHWGMLGGEPVAVKRIHRIFLEADVQGREHLLRAFKNECRFLKSLNHRNVVKFMGAYRDKEGPLLIMELMKESLDEFLKRKRGNLSLRRQLDICFSIAKGLATLHNRAESILHRDLTDRNVLLAEDGTVKIADFGQSKMINKPAQDLMSIQPGAVTYMPPEVLEHKPRYTSSIDTFSLGVLMLEIATQQSPQVALTDMGKKPEIIRRAVDLEKLDNGHRLKPLILWCLQECDCRPSVATICCQISILRDNVMMKENELNPDERRELEENIQELRGENQTLVENNRRLLLQVSQVQEQLSEEERGKEKLKEDNLAYMQIIEQYRSDFEAEREDREAAAGKFADREKEWMEQIRRAEDVCKQLSADKENLEYQLSTNRKALHTAFQPSERLRQENQTLKAELQHLHQTTQELQAIKDTYKHLSTEKENLEYRLSTNRKTLQTATQNNERLRQENETLRAEVRDTRRCSHQTMQDLQAMKDTCKQHTVQKENLENQLATKGEALHTATQHNDRLRRENQTLRAEVRDTRQRSLQTMPDLQAIKDTCKQLSAEKENLENQLATKGEALHTANQHNDRLRRENQTLRAEVKDTRQRSLQTMQNLQAINDTCKRLSAEKENLEYRLATKEKGLQTATQNNGRLRQENQTLRAEQNHLLQTTHELQEQMEKKNREINQLKLELRNRQKDVRKSKSPDAIHSRLYEKNKYATAMNTERITSQYIEEVEQENQTLKTQVEETRQALQEQQDQCQAVQAQNKQLQLELEYKNTWTGWVGTLFGSSNK